MNSRLGSRWHGCLLCLAMDCATAAPTELAVSDTVMLADFDDSSGAKHQRAMREALRVALDESPYLNLIPDAVTERALQEPGGEARPGKLGRICRAAPAKVYVSAALSGAPQDGTFEGELEAIDCASGARIAQERFTAGPAGLIDALGEAAGRLRLDLGEPRESLQKTLTPLSRAASGSLEALEAWSRALSVWRSEGPAAALPLLDQAVRTDPAFTAATYDLGLAYRNSGQEERARELFARAFAQREHASTRRRLTIAAQYHAFVTVDEKRAVEAFSAWSGSYPRDYKAVSNLGSFYGDICRYPQAIAQFERARQMNPSDVVSHEDLMEMLTAVGEFQKARAVYRDIVRLKLDDDSPHLYLFVIAALENNGAEMAAQAAWFADKKELQHEILSEQADAAAHGGDLERARALSAHTIRRCRH